jgi:hypothetical protein
MVRHMRGGNRACRNQRPEEVCPRFCAALIPGTRCVDISRGICQL